MKLTWYGHAAFGIEIDGANILIDPFLTGNPTFPDGMSVDEVSREVTHVLLTHGHDDHLGDTLDILKATGAQLTSSFEICMWAQGKGIENINPMGCGGTVDVGPFSVSLTIAHHSSSTGMDGNGQVYLGQPNGIVVAAPGEPVLYHMGDTDIFLDMELINELYAPNVGIVPIGDRFTMGAKTAALACRRFFDFDTIIPCHFGTFPIIDQDSTKFKEALGNQAGRMWPGVPGDHLIV